jgi:hypothetical protein
VRVQRDLQRRDVRALGACRRSGERRRDEPDRNAPEQRDMTVFARRWRDP